MLSTLYRVNLGAIMKKLIFSLLLLLLLLAGCNILAHPTYVIFGQSNQRVKAQYKGLSGCKSMIIISSPATLEFDYPGVRENIMLAIEKEITANVKKVQFVDQIEVEKFIKRELDWVSMPISKLARRFGADRVLYFDMYRFRMHEENAVGILRARIDAVLRVYEIDGEQPNRAVYSTDLEVVFPEHHPISMSDSALQKVQVNSVKQFAQQAAYKFYDHKIQIK